MFSRVTAAGARAARAVVAPPAAAAAPPASAGAWRLQDGGRSFSTMKSIKELPSSERKRTGHFGVEWFHGRKPTEINAQMVELQRPPFDPKPYKLDFSRYPGVASGLGAEYYFRDGQRSPLSYFHLRCGKEGDRVAVGATDPRAREARAIDNYVKEKTRGFAVQIVLEGRGVKAYFEPKFPHLMARLGVGAKVKDLTQYCIRDPDVQVSVSSKGDIITLHGPTKARVGTLAYRLLKVTQPKLMIYTGKGAHFAHHPARKKAVRKK